MEFRRRVIPEFQGEMARDAFVLFDSEATWADAGSHVLAWGSRILETEQRLLALLDALPKRESRG